MVRDVNGSKYEDWICISYLDIQDYLKITEHVSLKNKLKELFLIAEGYTSKISPVFFFNARTCTFIEVVWLCLKKEDAVRRSLVFCTCIYVEMRVWTFRKGLSKSIMLREEVIYWPESCFKYFKILLLVFNNILWHVLAKWK